MKSILKFCLLLAMSMTMVVFNSCNNDEPKKPIDDTSVTDKGVIINGVKWATRNVDAPGKFAPTPESYGKLYRWNDKRAWDLYDTTWDFSTPAGTSWEKENNPCPQGWRVPTQTELQKLLDAGNTWTMQNDVNGRLFGTAPNQIFLPATGYSIFGTFISTDMHGYFYWSSTQYYSNAICLYFYSGDAHMNSHLRTTRLSVRCVAE
jgi:uncharacterized protein (TIGR02145 family)